MALSERSSTARRKELVFSRPYRLLSAENEPRTSVQLLVGQDLRSRVGERDALAFRLEKLLGELAHGIVLLLGRAAGLLAFGLVQDVLGVSSKGIWGERQGDGISDSSRLPRQLQRAWRLTVAENDPLELALLRSAGENRLLDGVGGSETENEDRLRLANAVCAIHRLQIAGGQWELDQPMF
jgi:hypothetical protein